MGRQTGFHMLPEDAAEFLAHLKDQAPVVCTSRSSDSEEIIECDPTDCGPVLCLWNQAILPSLKCAHIARAQNPYYRVDQSLPVIEWMKSQKADWDGMPALTQGRVYASFDVPNEPLTKWFDSIVRWIRKNYAKNPIKWQSGYVGGHALRWHRDGGLLLPTYSPPTTPEWKQRLLQQRVNQVT
jgi:hypothetical protein